MTVSSANAGILPSDDSATPTGTTITKRIFDSICNVVVGQMTGVMFQDREGSLFSDRSNNHEGIQFSDKIKSHRKSLCPGTNGK